VLGFADGELAIDAVVDDAGARGVTGAEITSQKVKIENGKITEYRVEMDVIFILE